MTVMVDCGPQSKRKRRRPMAVRRKPKSPAWPRLALDLLEHAALAVGVLVILTLLSPY